MKERIRQCCRADQRAGEDLSGWIHRFSKWSMLQFSIRYHQLFAQTSHFIADSSLEAMAKQLYDYWFVQFDFPAVNGKPYKSSGGKMVWNEKLKREIPEKWNVNRLSDFINLYDYKRVPLSGVKHG